jgi:hypothetical protein
MNSELNDALYRVCVRYILLLKYVRQILTCEMKKTVTRLTYYWVGAYKKYNQTFA